MNTNLIDHIGILACAAFLVVWGAIHNDSGMWGTGLALGGFKTGALVGGTTKP